MRSVKTTTYNWSCHRCQVENQAGTVTCALCGFSAFASSTAILEARETDSRQEVDAVKRGATQHSILDGKTLWLFFPEAIPAVGAIAYSPIWFCSLVSDGMYSSATVLFIGVLLSLSVAFFGYRQKSKWLVYGAMLIALATALATNSVSNGN